MKMQEHKYILEGHKPVPCEDVLEWGRWMEDARKTDNRRVARTEIGKVEISTVFLGLDHNFSDTGEPVLFETMILRGKDFHGEWDYQERCSTWEQAEAMHEKAVEFVNAKLKGGKP